MRTVYATLFVLFALPQSNAREAVGTGLNGPAENFSSYTSEANRCGTTCQEQDSPAHEGGRTMCGLAVRDMVTCMSKTLGTSDKCHGTCGEAARN